MAMGRKVPETMTITTVGSAGAAEGSASQHIRGVFGGVAIKYDGSAPVTTNVLVELIASNGVVTEYLNITGNSDGEFRRLLPTHNADGTEDSQNTPLVNHQLRVTVTLSDALAAAVLVSPITT